MQKIIKLFFLRLSAKSEGEIVHPRITLTIADSTLKLHI